VHTTRGFTIQSAWSRAVANADEHGVTLVDVPGLANPSEGVAADAIDQLLARVASALRRSDELDLPRSARLSSVSSSTAVERHSSLSSSSSLTPSTSSSLLLASSSSAAAATSSDPTDWSDPESEAVFRGGWRPFASSFIQHGRQSVTLLCDECSTLDEVPQDFTASAPNPVVE
jgi:hypothetical protein